MEIVKTYFGPIVVMFFVLTACNRSEPRMIDYNAIKSELFQDTALSGKKELITAVLDFFKNEIPFQYSFRISVGPTRNNMVYLDELDRPQIDSLKAQLDGSTRIRIEKVIDSAIVDEAFLLDRIRNVFSTAEKYPWNSFIPDSILLNYLMPYKIVHDYPERWWDIMDPYYADTLRWWSSPEFSRFDVTDTRLLQLYTTFFLGELPQWWDYKASARTFTKFPSFSELLLLIQGDCNLEAITNVRILRTLGIPATVDEVPYWGSQNGSHAADVFWNVPKQKMVGAGGTGLYIPEIGRRPAKVVRHTFRYTGAFTDQIEPYLQGEAFQIESLKGDHWFDSTSDYMVVNDLKIPVGEPLSEDQDLGYIYVMNYGKWVPVFYGRVAGDSLFFSSMGSDLIYRAGFYKDGSHHFITRPFRMDLDGKLHYSAPNSDSTIEVRADWINMGAESWVQQGRTYTLQYLDTQGNWKDQATLECAQDSLLAFPDVPSDAFYRLNSPSDTRNLARIFLIDEAGEQVWY